MASGKIIIFYKYITIEYPKQVLKWQTKIATDLNLKGRVILAHEGINATLGGSIQNIDHYKSLMEKHPLFEGIDFKECEGEADYFPRLRIVIKDEIVRLGVDTKKINAQNGGKHLTPSQVHELLKNKPENLILFDARNRFESKVGTFDGAITPEIAHFRELPTYLDQHAQQFKDKQVLMFCTAGIRCERATAYLKEKGVTQEIYQLQGGIQRYVEQFPDGFFKGKNYVFDGRIAVRVSNDILSNCELCGISCDDYNNCMNASCNKHFICCSACYATHKQTCSEVCMELLENKKVKERPPLKKIISDTSCSLK
jgi:predicted sulfurtransferase